MVWTASAAASLPRSDAPERGHSRSFGREVTLCCCCCSQSSLAHYDSSHQLEAAAISTHMSVSSASHVTPPSSTSDSHHPLSVRSLARLPARVFLPPLHPATRPSPLPRCSERLGERMLRLSC